MEQPVRIHLPPPNKKGALSVEEALEQRRSVRHFSSRPLSQTQISQLLWAAQGITETVWRYRTAPSAGATYPLEVIVACGDSSIEYLGGGIYRYIPENHSLTQHHKGDVRNDIVKAALDQRYINEAPVSLIICSVYERTTRSYGARGERYVHIEVGHLGQNIYLEATALGLATVAIGAFQEDSIREILRLEKQCKPLYIMPVGKPA